MGTPPLERNLAWHSSAKCVIIKRMIRAIAAIDDKRGLATDEGIPWDLPLDREHERDAIKGDHMLMGYNTYLEFTEAPPDGKWLVVTDGMEPLRDGFTAVTNLEEFMKNPPYDLWLYGGAGLFAQTIKYAEELHITHVKGDFGCTKFFPEFEDDFNLVEKGEPQRENGITFTFARYTRKEDHGQE